nr:MAG TPA: hypothetical protein [Caudoviricetes sp.]
MQEITDTYYLGSRRMVIIPAYYVILFCLFIATRA